MIRLAVSLMFFALCSCFGEEKSPGIDAQYFLGEWVADVESLAKGEGIDDPEEIADLKEFFGGKALEVGEKFMVLNGVKFDTEGWELKNEEVHFRFKHKDLLRQVSLKKSNEGIKIFFVLPDALHGMPFKRPIEAGVEKK